MHIIDAIRARSALLLVNQTSGAVLQFLGNEAKPVKDEDVPAISRAITDMNAALQALGSALVLQVLPDTLNTQINKERVPAPELRPVS